MFKPLLSLVLWIYAGWSLGAFIAFVTGTPDFGFVIGLAFGAGFWFMHGRTVLRQATSRS
jgi:hypothetical protein